MAVILRIGDRALQGGLVGIGLVVVLVLPVAVHAQHEAVRHPHFRYGRVVLAVGLALHLAKRDDGRAWLLRQHVGQTFLVGVPIAVGDHQTAVALVGKGPLGIVHHLHVPVRDKTAVIVGLPAVRHGVKGIDGSVAIAVTAVFGQVFLFVRKRALQQVVVQRALDHALHALHVTRQQQLAVDLAHADACIRTHHALRRDVRRAARRRQPLGCLQVEPADVSIAFQRLPGEDIEVQAVLQDVQVQVSQQLLQHAVLLPHVILLITKKQQLVDAQLPEDGMAVGALCVHGLAAVIPVVGGLTALDVQARCHAVKHLVHHAQEGALGGIGFDRVIHNAQRTHMAVFRILQGRQRVYAAQLDLVQILVVALRVRLRLHIPRKEAHALAVDVHHRVHARRAEKVLHEVAGQQPHRGLLAQQVVKRVVHLARRLHGGVAEVKATLPVAYLQGIAAVAVRQDQHLDAVVQLVVVLSVYVHPL